MQYLLKEGSLCSPSFNKVSILISLLFAYHVILIKVNTPPWQSHRQATLVGNRNRVIGNESEVIGNNNGVIGNESG